MANGRTGVDGLDAELARQRERVADRSAPYERALALLPEALAGPAGRYLAAAWGHRTFHAWWDRPLLLLASMRFDALLDGEDHPLWQGFAAPSPRAEAVTLEALEATLESGRERLLDALAHRGVQTNDTSRAVAWLWPAHLAGLAHRARPVALVDVGASAGLNLVADELPPLWTDDSGARVPIVEGIHAVARVGLDPAPLDPSDPDAAAWLRACIWPGEPDRLARLDLAIATFRAARTRPDGPVLVPVASAAVPARLDALSAAERSAFVLAYQTIVRDYMPPAERAEYERGMRDWLASHAPGQALWVELESAEEGAGPDHPASIVAHVRAGHGVRDLELARCGYHPTKLRPREGAAAELSALLAPEAAAVQP
jgi:hypothetical protein